MQIQGTMQAAVGCVRGCMYRPRSKGHAVATIEVRKQTNEWICFGSLVALEPFRPRVDQDKHVRMM